MTSPWIEYVAGALYLRKPDDPECPKCNKRSRYVHIEGNYNEYRYNCLDCKERIGRSNQYYGEEEEWLIYEHMQGTTRKDFVGIFTEHGWTGTVDDLTSYVLHWHDMACPCYLDKDDKWWEWGKNVLFSLSHS